MIFCRNLYEIEVNSYISKLGDIVNCIPGKYIMISELQQRASKRQPTKEADADRNDKTQVSEG